MVERIVNGTFASDDGTGTGANPTGWIVSEPTNTSSIWVFNQALHFNRGDSTPNGSVSQTVTDIPGGQSVSFSFDYDEAGGGGIDTSVTYTIIRIAPDTTETVEVGPTLVTTPGPVTASFIPPLGGGPYSYRIVIADSSSATVGRDSIIDSVSFDAPLCFAKGTMIEAEHGLVPIEAISVGDLIMTADNGLQPVRWIGKRHVPGAILTANPGFRPIRIAAGALGENIPATDLIVSPQHRVLLRSGLVSRLFDADEVLVAAKHLLSLPGIEAIAPESVEYFHILFDWHEIIFANGAPAESLYLGEQSLRTLSPEGQAEVMSLFPELQDLEDEDWPASRPILKGQEGRRLAEETMHFGTQPSLVLYQSVI